MKKRFSLLMMMTALIFTVSMVISPMLTFADIADGTYDVNYEMKEAGNENTSIADGYFSKPATLTVKNGVKHIQLTVTSSSMIKSLSAPSGPVNVVSENSGNETRTVNFKVDDLSQPVSMDMHIVVPDLYDMKHTARADFDVSGLPAAGSAGGEESASEDEVNEAAATENNGSEKDEEAASGKAEENPPTGDETPIVLYVLLLIGASTGIFVVRKLRPARN